jgi:uncharacterized protein
MSEDRRVERVREYLRLYDKGDLDDLREYFSEQVVWRVAGNHPLSGTYRGRDELLDYFARVREQTEGTLHLEPESILVGDEHMGMVTRVTGRRNGRTLDVLLAQAFTIDNDGRWSEYWALSNDQGAVDAFWS